MASATVPASAIDSFVEHGFAVVDLLTEAQHQGLSALVLARLHELAANEREAQPFRLTKLADYHRLDVPADVHGRLLSGKQRFLRLSVEHERPFLGEAVAPMMDAAWGQHAVASVKRVDLDGRLVDHQCGFRVVRPGTADATLPHTDSDDGVFKMITVWTPIVGFDSRYSLKVFPGTHKLRHPSSAIVKNERLAALPYADEYVRQFSWVRPELRPGQAIVFHNELLHGSADNLGDETRVSLEVRLFGQA